MYEPQTMKIIKMYKQYSTDYRLDMSSQCLHKSICKQCIMFHSLSSRLQPIYENITYVYVQITDSY